MVSSQKRHALHIVKDNPDGKERQKIQKGSQHYGWLGVTAGGGTEESRGER